MTHERLKDTKGRLIPTVIAEHMSELAEKEFRAITLNHEDTVLRIVAADGNYQLRTSRGVRDGSARKTRRQ